ncbi:hypothetical protein [Eubacterium sp. AB3007]|uniref:hypothetical protein n=1 Tax=Eubacterium sp. AB3007 TaxID=1392487 RepID=UPI0004879639|nr:hypothetical protein [Eubacterium sp. AB3007]
MLTQERIEEALHLAMLKYAKENNGADGWRREDLEDEIASAGGEEIDLLHAMQLGMELCEPNGIRPFRLTPNAEGRDALSYVEDVEKSLSVIATNADAIEAIALETAADVPESKARFLFAIHALAKELMEYEMWAEEDLVEIRRQLKNKQS